MDLFVNGYFDDWFDASWYQNDRPQFRFLFFKYCIKLNGNVDMKRMRKIYRDSPCKTCRIMLHFNECVVDVQQMGVVEVYCGNIQAAWPVVTSVLHKMEANQCGYVPSFVSKQKERLYSGGKCGEYIDVKRLQASCNIFTKMEKDLRGEKTLLAVGDLDGVQVIVCHEGSVVLCSEPGRWKMHEGVYKKTVSLIEHSRLKQR